MRSCASASGGVTPALLLPVLLEPGRKRRWLASVAAVAGMTLLANLHAGGGTIALALLFASTAGTLARSGGEPGTRLRAAGLLVASAVAASLSPGYLKGTYTALRMESATRALFHEWQPPAAYFDAPAADLFVRGHHLLMGALPYVTALALAGLSLALLWRRGLDASRAMKDLPAVALAFAACILSMRSVRFVPYVLLALPGLLALIACLRDAETRPSRPLTPRLAAAAVACGLLLVFGAHLYRAGFSGGLRAAVSAWQEDLVPGLYPVGVADHLEATGAEGGVFNLSALHGSYLIWRLWPRVSVHFDGRGNLDAEEAARIELLRQRRAHPRMGGRTEEIYLETGLPFVLAPAPVFPPNAPPKAFRLRAADPVAQLWERVSPRD